MKRPTAIRIPTRSDGNDLLITCSRAVELGVDGVEWAVGAGDLFEVPAPGTDFPEVVSVAAECALTEISPAIDRVNNLLQQSAQVGARCLALGLPGVSFEAGSGCFSRYQEVLDFVYALLREVRFEAEACGVPIAVEAMRDQSLMSPSELRGIVDGANSWAVGVCVDTGTPGRAGSCRGLDRDPRAAGASGSTWHHRRGGRSGRIRSRRSGIGVGFGSD